MFLVNVAWRNDALAVLSIYKSKKFICDIHQGIVLIIKGSTELLLRIFSESCSNIYLPHSWELFPADTPSGYKNGRKIRTGLLTYIKYNKNVKRTRFTPTVSVLILQTYLTASVEKAYGNFYIRHADKSIVTVTQYQDGMMAKWKYLLSILVINHIKINCLLAPISYSKLFAAVDSLIFKYRHFNYNQVW